MRINDSTGFAAARGATSAASSLTRGGARMASGLRINSSADDAAGLAISEQLRAELGGLRTAGRNVQDGASMAQVADGALGEATDILHRMRDLASSANGGISDGSAEQAEFDQLNERLDELGVQTSFGGSDVFGTGGTTIQAGGDAGATLTIDPGALSAGNVGTAGLDLTSDPGGAISAIDGALQQVTQQRADLGATANRLESAGRNLSTTSENLMASESRVRDADMAFEAMTRNGDQVMLRSSIAMAAQANASRGTVLGLLT